MTCVNSLRLQVITSACFMRTAILLAQHFETELLEFELSEKKEAMIEFSFRSSYFQPPEKSLARIWRMCLFADAVQPFSGSYSAISLLLLLLLFLLRFLLGLWLLLLRVCLLVLPVFFFLPLHAFTRWTIFIESFKKVQILARWLERDPRNTKLDTIKTLEVLQIQRLMRKWNESQAPESSFQEIQVWQSSSH